MAQPGKGIGEYRPPSRRGQFAARTRELAVVAAPGHDDASTTIELGGDLVQLHRTGLGQPRF